MPALAGHALGFLAMAGSLRAGPELAASTRLRWHIPRPALAASGACRDGHTLGEVAVPADVRVGGDGDGAGGNDGPVSGYLAVRIGPSAVRLVSPSVGGSLSNTGAARVLSEVYLGDQRDLRFELPDGTLIRALVSANEGVAAGSETVLHFPVQDCRLVADA